MSSSDAQSPAPAIHISDFVSGARTACGLAVIIDVFRAFSVAAYAFAAGARSIIPLACIDQARLLKQQHPDYLLVGERFARPLPGFDHGNSPTELQARDLTGRTLLHTTHAGTQGLVQADNAQEVITGALVNAAAIVRYIRSRRFQEVTLVRMGQHATERCVEDDVCAELIARRLRGERCELDGIRERLRAAPSAAKFFDPACPWAPASDFELCAQLDRFDFVLQLDRQASPCELRLVPVA
jgi:2-phosphosulfolactate phosphatase